MSAEHHEICADATCVPGCVPGQTLCTDLMGADVCVDLETHLVEGAAHHEAAWAARAPAALRFLAATEARRFD